MANDITQELEHEEFDELSLMLDWFKCEWGNESDPIPDDIVELEEDYELKNIGQLKELSSTEV